VRIIAATNRDLPAEIEQGRFRSDLYFRLNVFPLELPALRQRGQDVSALAEFFLERFAHKHQKPISKISANCMQRLLQYTWPGNVRDLQNVIERAVILCDDAELDIPWGFDDKSPGKPSLPSSDNAESEESQAADPPYALREIERRHIIATLKQTRGVIDGPNGAAMLLELKPSTARFRIRKLGISKSDYLE
jgi:transcriptional regulator with GAF, ATPase, and Fis domain